MFLHSRARGAQAGRFWPGGLTVILALLMLSLADKATKAQETQPVKVPAKLNCGSHSSDPNQLKSFQTDLQFSVVDSLWYLDRKTENRAGPGILYRALSGISA